MRRVPALAALLAALAGGCGGCPGERGGPPPERFLPAGAALAVIVPDAGRASRELAALHATLATFPRTGELAAARTALAAQLGFDPLDPEALAGAGLDRRRGAGLALLEGAGEPGDAAGPPARALLALPVREAARLEDLLARLGRERLGAEHRTVESRGAAELTILRRAEGGPAALAWTIVERTALVAAGPGGPDVVADAAALAPDRALAAAPAFAAARRVLGDRDAALIFLPPGAPALRDAPLLREGAAVALSASEGRLSARAAILAAERAAALRALAGGGTAAGAALRLAPGSALVVRWDGEPPALARHLLPLVPARDRAWLSARGFELERDLLPHLAPGAAAALALAPGARLGSLSAAALREDPLALLGFEVVLPVRDVAAAEAAAAALARALSRGGSDAGAAEPGAQGDGAARPPVHRVATASGELAWTVDREGARVLAAGGAPGRLDELRARLAGEGEGFAPPTEAARAALEGGLGGAALDVARLVASVRAIPAEAFGTGPAGFVVRSVVNRFVDPAERLAAVSLRAELEGDALVVELEAEARPRPGARP